MCTYMYIMNYQYHLTNQDANDKYNIKIIDINKYQYLLINKY